LYPKYFQGLNGWEVNAISAGGNTLFALAETSCISWGQGCSHGELGHGKDRSRSATNAVKVDDLEGSKVRTVSCGLGNTVLTISENDVNFKNLEVAGELVEESPLGYLLVN
jgi:alpha-tubulin suppressor-like RCC1 family protein